MVEKILVVEDEWVLRETLAYNLKKQGYEVTTAADGNLAVELARQIPPDLVLLDIMLPGLDGFEVCRILRQDFNGPIIMLTARADEVDKVVGLEVGADDYLTKPFSVRELLARVKAQLRRVRLLREEFATDAKNELSVQLRFDDLVIDLERHEVLLNGGLLALKPKDRRPRNEAPVGAELVSARDRADTRSAPTGTVGRVSFVIPLKAEHARRWLAY
ncbi:MAG: response regulator transcription factor, partial [Lysobacterales bacterium]